MGKILNCVFNVFFNLSIIVYGNKLIKKLPKMKSLPIIELYIRMYILQTRYHRHLFL